MEFSCFPSFPGIKSLPETFPSRTPSFGFHYRFLKLKANNALFRNRIKLIGGHDGEKSPTRFITHHSLKPRSDSLSLEKWNPHIILEEEKEQPSRKIG
ncbi:hypothetical protein CDAR_172711 [Caerostris darwini]|uniref:Ycf15 n=1 Tax=Caerostris darwini TaxID=1538125 RepID=A0AAV4MEG9_9ARAC|nr:hypothetical protein CDAR_172711 [Caerostris darwini]